MDLVLALVLALIGLLAGAASGLFGVGGGILVVPGLVLVAGLSFTDAVAASLLFILCTSPFGVWRHWVHKNVDFERGLLLGATGVAGVFLGELVQRYVSERHLIIAFSFLLLWAAQHLAYGRLPRPREPSRALLAAVGVFAGLVAKLFGIGGGIVVVPALVFVGLTVHRAVGTSLVSVFLNALVATGINVFHGTSWAPWALPPALGALLGIQWGVRTGVRMHARALQDAFAILLCVVALELVRRGF